MAERGEASSIPTIFFDYFGENLLRSDLSISVGDLGSLLDHTGPIGDHETYAARVFGAHRTGDLADQMFLQLKTSNQTQWLGRAFSTLPVQVMTPHKAYQRLVRGHVEHVPLTGLADHVLATSVVPYPPGIPMLMPGQSTGPADGPYLRYLRALASWDQRFPGFGHDTHGVENRNGVYYAQCLLPSRAGDVETQPQTVSQDLVEV
jgi:arginine/lysine/ornithine decarboxylase